jgi:hypothetical protein
MGYSYSSFACNVIAGYGMDWTRERRTPRLEYIESEVPGRTRITTLLDHRNQFEGKIVVLQPNDVGGIYSSPTYSAMQEYATIIDNLVQDDVLIRSHTGTFLVVFLSIVITGMILYGARPLTATALLVLFWGLALYLPAWLFQVQGILIDVPAMFAALVVSVVVFAVVSLGHEWRTIAAQQTASSQSIDGVIVRSLNQKRITLSPAAAVGFAALIMVASVALTLVLRSQSGRQAKQEVVYVMSLPAIEVQGDNPAESSKQQ